MASGLVFVTVGTTEFDKLIVNVLDRQLLAVLNEKGFKKLRLQIGNGATAPRDKKIEGIEIEHYRFKDSLIYDIQTADLVISHAGAGSCLEILEARKPLIVVVNDELMHNHQWELADALSKRNHVVAVSPGSLLDALRTFDPSRLEPLPAPDKSLFVNFLNNIMRI